MSERWPVDPRVPEYPIISKKDPLGRAAFWTEYREIIARGLDDFFHWLDTTCDTPHAHS